MGRGQPIDRALWAPDGPHRRFLEFVDKVHRDNGVKSLRNIAQAMHLSAHSRVYELLHGSSLPVDDNQARDLISALGGSAEDITHGLRLYRKSRSSSDDDAGSARRGPAELPRLLRSYLEAAARAIRGHPYPGVIPGIAPPPLAAVYLRQYADALTLDGQDATPSIDRKPLSGVDIFGLGSNCIVLGGPGHGKSSLLRVGLAASASRWLANQRDTAVPVLVSAADLIGQDPLPRMLARAVTAELSAFGLMEELPADFFQTEPYPGARWQLLVDGLDEIIDHGTRYRAMMQLTAIVEDKDRSPYQFVLATRPFAQEGPREWAPPGVRCYELLPFSLDDLAEFAERWFTVLALPEPGVAGELFAGALRRSPLADLARVPLMATMLCQLYADDADHLPPAGRNDIYRQFIDLLNKRQHAGGRGGISAQTHTALKDYGPSALSRAQHTLDHLQTLITYLAAERRAGNTQPTVEILTGHPDAARPDRVPDQTWAEILGESLQRSGLLAAHEGDFSFLHQTILDYLAARYTARHTQSSAQEFRRIFERSWTRRPPGYFDNIVVKNEPFIVWNQGIRMMLISLFWLIGRGWRRIPRPRKSWNPPVRAHEDASYIGFLTAEWCEAGKYDETLQALLRIAGRGRLRGCEFIARLIEVGNWIPEIIIATAADTLTGLAEDSGQDDFERLLAVEALCSLTRVRGLDALAALSNDPSLETTVRWRAAHELADRGDDRAQGAIAALSTDPDLEIAWRRDAAESLFVDGAELDQGLLVALLGAPKISWGLRDILCDALVNSVLEGGSQARAELETDPAFAALSPFWRGILTHQLDRSESNRTQQDEADGS